MPKSKYDGPKFQTGAKCIIEQYKMLIRCSEKGDRDKGDVREWNEWREENPKVDVILQGADLDEANLQGAFLSNANLQGAKLWEANLQGAFFNEANLQGAELWMADLQGAKLYWANMQGAKLQFTNMQGADFTMAAVDGETVIDKCEIDKETDFTSVGLDDARIDPRLKQTLKYNIRRKQWEKWYSEDWRYLLPPFKHLFVRPFWWVSDYGKSTFRIILFFIMLSLLFANIYHYWGIVAPPGIVENLYEQTRIVNGNEVTEGIPPGMVALRSIYFSVVTMTTLGFGDIYAKATSYAGYLLLMLQVVLGYVMLGSLITRFGVMFTGGGPAAPFTPIKKPSIGKRDKTES